MEEVTDCAFREMFARYSGGHHGTGNMKHGACPNVSSFMLRSSFKNNFVMFTEFINVDGLDTSGREKEFGDRFKVYGKSAADSGPALGQVAAEV